MALATFAWWPGGASAQDAAENEFLEVYSEGYSRFEISEGSVVAFYTGGVEFSYQGYRLSAEELRYNQATGKAEVSGGVKLLLDDGSLLETEQITLDAEAGLGAVPGPLSGTLSEQGVKLVAGSANFTFPPGLEIDSIEQLTLQLADGVLLETTDGYRLTTASAEFDGATSRISAPGQVAVIGGDPLTDAVDGAAPQWISLTGSGLTGELSEGTGVKWLEVAGVNAELIDGWLSAGKLRLEPSAPGVRGAEDSWYIQLLNGPVSGMLRQEAGDLTIVADVIAGTVDNAGVREIALSGTASVERADMVFESSDIKIRRGKQGFSFAAEGLSTARLDLAQLSDTEPLDIATIKSWLE